MPPLPPLAAAHELRVGMVGMGMIFDETYRPFFERSVRCPLYDPGFGVCSVPLTAVATRTGQRADAYRAKAPVDVRDFQNFAGPGAVEQLVGGTVDAVCIATPDDRHFAAAKLAIESGKHVLIEKPSVLKLSELDELQQLALDHGVLAKVVYHKLLDPDHKKLRTFVADDVLQHVNNGYCSLPMTRSCAALSQP